MATLILHKVATRCARFNMRAVTVAVAISDRVLAFRLPDP